MGILDFGSLRLGSAGFEVWVSARSWIIFFGGRFVGMK